MGTRDRNGVMAPSEFKARWESDERGGGITFEDMARCYEAWGLGSRPCSQSLSAVANQVLQKAGVKEYLQEEEEQYE